MSELSSASNTPPRNQRPSLMASPDAEADNDAFGVSILSAARAEPKAAGAARATKPAPRPGRWLWWIGIAAVAAGMWGAAHWRKQAAEPATMVASLPAPKATQSMTQPVTQPVTQSITQSSPAPKSAPVPSPTADAPAPAVLQDILADAKPTPPTTPPVLQELAAERGAAKVKPSTPPAKAVKSPAPVSGPGQAPVAAAASAVAPTAKTRDRDAELVAAVMAHAEGESAKAPTYSTKPLSAPERDRFAATLRQCKEQFGNDIARDACRAQACDASRYWGRTKSCPLQVDAPAPRGRKS